MILCLIYPYRNNSVQYEQRLCNIYLYNVNNIYSYMYSSSDNDCHIAVYVFMPKQFSGNIHTYIHT